ncbi:hypothetical protein JOL79_31650 [Microbispora sp. RL4-1S]|uniref:HTH luxR-type domain-containing protein n=1 Tax=Microbispora oryzae TaxID=2806554 RepID=A0A941ANH1_9ACTN|nr:helix-turn-helix domain-containing protein [Microbispora oryzae]MBP2708343.1 hypothetical protein [Microbispora oryzae]
MTVRPTDGTSDHHDLAGLGVSEEEERVYRALLREPNLNAQTLAAILDVPAARILERLQALGMVKLGSNNKLVAVDPNIVVERLIELRLDNLQTQLQRTLSARHVVSGLLQDKRKDLPDPLNVGVEPVEGLDRVRELIEELSFYTHGEMLAIQPDIFSAEAIAATRRGDLRCLRRGLSFRTIVRKETLEDEATARYLRELASHGAQIRLAEGRLERVLVFDQITGIVPLDPNSSSRGVLVIRAAGLISGLVTLFDRIWREAMPHPFGLREADEEPPPSEIERQVLSAMARGDKDEMGARTIGISVRTYRSHVAGLIQRLGAESRFQAALRARERGWL